MASVKINIPNIGEVEAVNAATEETLQKILAATLKSEKAKQAENAGLVKAQKEQQKKRKVTQIIDNSLILLIF